MLIKVIYETIFVDVIKRSQVKKLLKISVLKIFPKSYHKFKVGKAISDM